ncbi:acyl-CoA dehydrogenase family protein [Pararhodobacter zhoushanensis]|uniref:Acyl-CoA dehydrogenase family protein n=1 Tax=Pararhodobacter zhoushanensis TaxID=2479545 RepID=A0ABT3H5B4_9RHOB|nr:acyl-CoA dehydrogenase family protein [Pararhodobacter zhoushanensis]MCW1935003.1 acyl-CoA dehydrogenase family protein [Pararhodobacter zhoushanensis]
MLDTTNGNEELIMFRESVRRMTEKEVAPIAARIDQDDHMPHSLVPVFGDLGLIQIMVPEEYGGPGGTTTMACIAKEEVSRASFAVSHLVGATSIAMALPLVHFGTEEQRQRYLPEIAEGRTLSCIGLTEPHTGSDVSGIKTSARKEGGDYVINGQKVFITKADQAKYILLFARTSEGKGHDGISSFLIPMDTPGITIGGSPKKMGLRGIKNCDLFFENVRVPADTLIGAEGQGFKNAMGVLNLNRPTVAAASIGIAQAALDASLAYAKERVQFGRPIAEFQLVQAMLADMAIQIEAARALLYQVTALIDREPKNPRIPMLASMIKTFASDMAMKVTTDAVQVFGGAGYLQDNPVERYMRDAKVCQIYEGTNQIQRLIIARAMLKQ